MVFCLRVGVKWKSQTICFTCIFVVFFSSCEANWNRKWRRWNLSMSKTMRKILNYRFNYGNWINFLLFDFRFDSVSHEWLESIRLKEAFSSINNKRFWRLNSLFRTGFWTNDIWIQTRIPFFGKPLFCIFLTENWKNNIKK